MNLKSSIPLKIRNPRSLAWGATVLLFLFQVTGVWAGGFSVPELVELPPLGDIRIRLTNTTGAPIQGLRVNIHAPELAEVLHKKVYQFPGKLKPGESRELILKTRTNPKRWQGLLAKARELALNHTRQHAISVSAIGQAPLYPVFRVRSKPIKLIETPHLLFKGDRGSYVWLNDSKQKVKLEAIQFKNLPPQLKVVQDSCSHRGLGPNKTCAVELELVESMGTLQLYGLSLPFKSALNTGDQTRVTPAVETGNGMDLFDYPDGSIGPPEGIYVSSCQNISFDDSTETYPLTADCIYWNSSTNQFAINLQTTLNYSDCTSGGSYTGEVISDPLTGKLACATATVLATQDMPPGNYVALGCENPSWDSASQYLTCSNISTALYYPGCQGTGVWLSSGKDKWLGCNNGFSSQFTDVNNISKLWGFSDLSKDGSTFAPWSTLSCDSSEPSCTNATGLSVYANPLLSTSNFGFEMQCQGDSPGYQVAAPPTTPSSASWFSGQIGLIGIGPFEGDQRVACNGSPVFSGYYFGGQQTTLYYNHGNTMRGCDTSAQTQGLGMSYGNGFFANQGYWQTSTSGGGLTTCNTLAETYGFTPSNPNYQGQTGFGENYQLTWAGADFPATSGIQLITPGAKYYPQYAFFMVNSTNAPITVPASSFSVNYCQNVTGWQTAGWVIGEALAYIMGAGLPTPGADEAGEFVNWTMNAAAASSSVISAYGDFASTSCPDGTGVSNISFPNSDTTIKPNEVAFLGAQELDNFDFVKSWTVPTTLTPGSPTPVTFQQTNPLVFNDGFHAMLFSVDNSNRVKVTAISDIKQFSLANYMPKPDE